MSHFLTDDEMRAARELDAGEQLLWTGRPAPTVAAQRGCGQSVTGVVVLGFALFWMSGAFWITRQDSSFYPPPPRFVPGPGTDVMPFVNSPPVSSGPSAETLFPLFGLIFVAVGLYLICAPFINATKASDTLYAVSDRRALILEGSGALRVQSFTSHDLKRIERRDRDANSGDVVFARRHHRNSKGHSYEEEIGFFGVPNAREAERLLRELAGS